MGNLKIMTRACMPRHARACMFLTLSLYMIMHVSNRNTVLSCIVKGYGNMTFHSALHLDLHVFN